MRVLIKLLYNSDIMNILIFSWRGPGHPIAGGAELVTHEHTKAWVAMGHTVTLFTSSYKGASAEEVIDGVKVIRQSFQTFGVQIAGFFWYLFGNHEKFDLVVDQFHGIPFFTPLYVRVKKLAFIHEVTKEVWRLNPWPKPFNLIPGIIGTVLESFMFKFFYKGIPFMTVSASTKKDLKSWGIDERNIHVIHNGVSIPRVKKNPKKESINTVMFLGALSKDKGTEDAIKVFSLIDKIESDWQFWIVGNGEDNYLNYLVNLTYNMGISKKVKFWGFVPDDKKFELLARAHIMINPSVREGWGLVNLEAAGVGTPVVGYNAPGVRDSVVDGKTGILVYPGNTKMLAREVVKLLNDKAKYSKMSEASLAWSKKFTWGESVKESLELIEKI